MSGEAKVTGGRLWLDSILLIGDSIARPEMIVRHRSKSLHFSLPMKRPAPDPIGRKTAVA